MTYSEELSALTRAELVSLAKKNGIKANQKSIKIVAALVALSSSEKDVVVPSSPPLTPKQNVFEAEDASCITTKATTTTCSTPDLQNMTYNEIRSLAKATPGVKVRSRE